MIHKEVTLIKQVNRKSVCFVIISILKMLVINFNHIFVMVVMLCILWSISRDDAVNRLNNSALEDKGVL